MALDTKRPTSVKIGLNRWAIKWGQIEGGEWGLCDPDSQTIYIDDTKTKDVQKSTLLHECLHAIWVTYGFEVKATFKEEVIVSRLEMPLLLFISSNKGLINWIS